LSLSLITGGAESESCIFMQHSKFMGAAISILENLGGGF
jgi:hypothetical protein